MIGAGPAGLAAATLLAEQQTRVLLLDEQPAPGGQIYRNIERARRNQRCLRPWARITVTAPARGSLPSKRSSVSARRTGLAGHAAARSLVQRRWPLAADSRRGGDPCNRRDGASRPGARLDIARRHHRRRAADHAEIVRRCAGRTVCHRRLRAAALPAGAAMPRGWRSPCRGARHDGTHEPMARDASPARGGIHP